MKKILTYTLICISIIGAHAQLDRDDETVTKEVEWEISDFYEPFHQGGDFNTPITSYKGSTYFVYVDSIGRPILGKIAKTGIVTTSRLDKDDDDPYFAQIQDSHNKFSLGIDKEGYIHVVGDYHNYGAEATFQYVDRYKSSNYNTGSIIRGEGNYNLYWVSENAEDISSFEFRGGDLEKAIPGNGFSYSSFHSDMNGELYVRHRARVSGGGHYIGERGWVAAKYNLAKKTWTEIGGESPNSTYPHNYDTLFKSIFWEDNGIAFGNNLPFYQGFSGDMRFDFNNRWHVTTPINNDNDVLASTDVLYAYSDDGGLSFNKADGSVISELPIRVETASIVSGVSESPEGYHIWSSVSTDKDGIPIISYTKLESAANNIYMPGDYKYWDKENNIWTEGNGYPSGGHHSQTTVLDANGIVSYIGSDTNGLVTRDVGLSSYTTKAYNHHHTWLNGSFFGIDQRGIREQNVIRGFVYTPSKDTLNPGGPGSLKIVKIQGTPKSLAPISEEWDLTALNGATNDQSENRMFNDIFQLKSTGIFNENFSGEYINQTVAGDFELEARVINVNFINEDSFAGLMVRENNDKDSSFFGTAITSYNGVKTISKGASNDTTTIAEGYEPSEWLKIKRTGNLLESYRSDNGQNWEKLDSREIEMNETVTYGLVSGSGNTTDKGHARMDHVSLTNANLIAHYQFNNNLLDATVNNLNGANTAASNFIVDGKNQSLSLDETDNHISVNSNTLLKSNNLTVSAWIKPYDLEGENAILKSVGGDGFSYGWRFATFKNSIVARVSTDQGSRSATVAGLIENEWNHVAFTYDNENIVVSINGGKELTQSAPLSGDIIYNSNDAMRIGISNGVDPFYGEIDELKIYNRADQDYVLENYEEDKDYFNGLIVNYKFNNNVLDSGINNLNGTNNGISFEASSNYAVGHFNGESSVSVKSNDLLKTEKITVSAWIKPYNLEGQNAILKSVGGDGFSYGWRLVANGNTITARVSTDQDNKSVTVAGLIENEWNHVSFTYDNEDIVIFLNGGEELSKSTPLSGDIIYNSNDAMRIGISNGVDPFYGEIDEVKIYNTALDRSSILENYRVNQKYSLSSFSSKNLVDSGAQSASSLEQNSITITLYPNPTNGAINIMYPDFLGNEDLQIIDTTGRTLINKKLEGVNSIIDISNLEPSIYFVKISTPNGKVNVRKIVVE